MHIRKFEAKTMQEILHMIKVDLGSKAIILSVRDNTKGFGLIGEKSLEVTAAVSTEDQPPSPLPKTSGLESPVQVAEKLAVNAEGVQITHNPKYSLSTLSALASQSHLDVEDSPNSDSEFSSKVQVERLKKRVLELESVIDEIKNNQGFETKTYPGAKAGLSYELSSAYSQLKDAGMNKKLITETLLQVQKKLPAKQEDKKEAVEKTLADQILKNTQVVKDFFEEKVHIFVGPAGQGKTSTMIKVASHLVMNEQKKVALFSAGTKKLDGCDQVEFYAKILDVPCGRLFNEGNWSVLLSQLEEVDHILVDVPGLSLKELSEISQLKKILPSKGVSNRVHYVQSAIVNDRDAFETARRYRVTRFQDVIFTHLDEALDVGFIYNFQKEFQVPLHSFGIGPQIPDDFERATPEKLLNRLFNKKVTV